MNVVAYIIDSYFRLHFQTCISFSRKELSNNLVTLVKYVDDVYIDVVTVF
jgi:hypothetical protein